MVDDLFLLNTMLSPPRCSLMHHVAYSSGLEVPTMLSRLDSNIYYDLKDNPNRETCLQLKNIHPHQFHRVFCTDLPNYHIHGQNYSPSHYTINYSRPSWTVALTPCVLPVVVHVSYVLPTWKHLPSMPDFIPAWLLFSFTYATYH